MKIKRTNNTSDKKKTADTVAVVCTPKARGSFDIFGLSLPVENTASRNLLSSANKLLHPDNNIEVDDNGRAPTETTRNRYSVNSIRIGENIIDVTKYYSIDIMISGNCFDLSFKSDDPSLSPQEVSIDKANITKMYIFTGKLHGIQPYIDMHLSVLPDLFSKMIEPDNSYKRAVRIILEKYVASLEFSLRRVFPNFKVHQEWCDYNEREVSRCASIFKRSSSRLTCTPSYSEASKSPSSPATPSTYFSRRSSRLSSLCGIKEPLIPDKTVPLFVYPEAGTDGITITTSDTPRLEDGIFLNDSLVDFDLRFQLENCSESLSKRVHLYSSFFFKRLSDEGQTGVKKWTDGVDIFSKDFLIIPICEHLHWYLVIVCHPQRIINQQNIGSTCNNPIEFENELMQSLCHILVFDSLGRHRIGTLSKLKLYLVDEARDKLDLEASKELSQGIMVRCPRQENYTDCGLFCGQFVEAFLKDPDSVVVRAKEHQLATWFPPQDAHDRRQRLKELVGRIASTATYVHPNDSFNSSDIEEIICL